MQLIQLKTGIVVALLLDFGDFKQLIGGRNNPLHLLATFAELKSQ